MAQRSQSDHWIKCVSRGGGIRAVAIQAKNLVQKNIRNHKLGDAAARALGEVMIGGLFFASNSKGKDRINIKVSGSKAFTYAFVDSYPDGTVRGYLVERPQAAGGAISMPTPQGPWGEGLLSVLWTKSQMEKDSGTPFVGTVPLLTGHFAKDLTFYWVQSEQIPTAIGIGVKVKKGKITAAGGFMIQALGGASEEEISRLEAALTLMPDMQKQFEDQPDPMKNLEFLFGPKAFKIVEKSKIKFKCQCSRGRVIRALKLLGTKELAEIQKKEKFAKVRCDFCAKNYKITGTEIKKLINAGKLQK